MQDREANQKYYKTYWEKLKADPERLAAHNERKRQESKRKWQNIVSDPQKLAEWNEKRKIFREKNAEKIKESKRQERLRNRDRYLKRDRERYIRDREKRLAAAKIYNKENKKLISERNKNRRINNPEMFRAYQVRNRKFNRAGYMFSSIKKAAKTKGLKCDLDREWFEVRLAAGTCEMSGLPFDLDAKMDVGGRGPNVPSIDRIDPKGDYTKDNCRMILWWLNRALVNMGDEYCLNVMRAVFIKRGEMLPMERKNAA